MKKEILTSVAASLLLLCSCGNEQKYQPVTIQADSISNFSVKYKQEKQCSKTIHVKLNDVVGFDAVFDTGCSFDLVISPIELVNLYKVNAITDTDKIGVANNKLANGEIVNTPIFNIKELSITDTNGKVHALYNKKAHVMEKPEAPFLLGDPVIDELAGKKSYTVDLQENLIKFNN